MNANFSRMVVGEVSPMLIVGLRWIGTVCLLLIFARKQFLKDWPTLKKNWPFLIAMGALGLTAFNGLFYVAAHTTTAINIGIIQGAIPVFVVIGTVLLYHARVRQLQILGIFVTIIGVIVVTVDGQYDNLVNLAFKRGDILMVIACFLYAGYSVGLRKCPKVAPLSLFTVFAIGALIAALPLVAMEFTNGNILLPSTKGWVIVLLITLFPSFIAQITFIKAVAIIGAGRAGIFFNLIPVFAALFAVIILDETFAFYHGLALILVLGGIGLSEWGKKKEF